mmetsp:Transcript_10769/g.31817  ORF Transcript_10769/g.31817 Transcript_10769/m.31817 type:complete len:266 (-) Transcript_10769:218-1015(-)
MWWLVAAAGLFFFRGKIAQYGSRFLPSSTPQETAFMGHLIMLGSAIGYVPLSFLGAGRSLYLISMWSTIVTSLLTIRANYGPPPTPQKLGIAEIKAFMPTLQPWLQGAMTGPDFPFLFFCLIFVTAYPSIPALLILGRRSLWSVCTYCAKNTPERRLWKAFSGTWDRLKAKEKEVLAYAAMAEILLAIWMTASLLLPTRQLMATFLYWNYLRTRYQVPRSHPLHLQAWTQLGQHVQPVLTKVPLLNKPLDMAKGWFAPQYVQQQR